MSATLSYPVPALRSAKSRAQIAILEPDAAVLDYLRTTLAGQYAISLYSDEQLLLDRLQEANELDLLLLALHPTRDSIPLLTQIRSAKPRLPVIVLSCSAELKDLEKNGYNPAGDQTNYPQNIQNAEKKSAAAKAASAP